MTTRDKFLKFGIPLIIVSLVIVMSLILAIKLSQKPNPETKGHVNKESKPPGKVFGFDDIFNGKYSFFRYSVRWMSDDEYLRYSRGNLTVTNLSRNTTRVFPLSQDIMQKYNVSSYWMSPDEKWVLMASNQRQLFRRSFFADYYVHNLESRSTFRVHPPNPAKQIQLALWANNGTSIGCKFPEISEATAWRSYPDRLKRLMEITQYSYTRLICSHRDRSARYQCIVYSFRYKRGLVQDNDIYWLDKVGGRLHTITNNGKENELFNGVPDWVYEGMTSNLVNWCPELKDKQESAAMLVDQNNPLGIEFHANNSFQGINMAAGHDVTHSNSAMWFSPDGRYLVFVQSNDTQVKWFPYMWYGENSALYTTVKRIAYPKPGSPNPVVTIKVVDLQNLPPNVTDTPNSTVLLPPAEFQAVEHYYTNVAWASNSSVMIWWLNRVQNKAIASICNVTSASCKENQNLQAKRGWVDAKSYSRPSPMFAHDGSYYLTLAPSPQGEHGDFIHLAKVKVPSSSSKDTTFLTKGAWEVTRILAFNDKTETVYFQSSETSPRERHIYSVNVKSQTKACLSCDLPWAKSGDCKLFTASFSPGASWYVLNCYGPKVPRATLHKSSSSTWYKELQMNEGLQKQLSEISTPKRRNFVIPAGKYELLATEILPPDFDENKKYAVHFDVYGGPGSQKVIEQFGSAFGWTAYLVSNFNVIVVTVDGRGTGSRGERFKQSVYKLLGEYEAQDVITAGRFMQKKSYVDPKRLSVWGWSYGGFLTTYVLSKNTGVFKCGIAVAPVTDWRYYDSAYTERYMGLPKDNPNGYRDTSLLSRAANFSNVDFLIIHGSGDDNVHYQHTAQMVKALTEAEVKFRVQYYTDKAHGITGLHTRRHLFRLMTNFLVRSLGLTRT